MKSTLRAWLAGLTCLLALHAYAAHPDKGITVFAAASLTNVLQDLGDTFAKDTSIPVRFSFAASSTLARQIENGSRADLFVSADLEWMDYLQARNLIQPATRHDLLGNQLVLIARVDSKIALKIAAHFPLAAAVGHAASQWARQQVDTRGVMLQAARVWSMRSREAAWPGTRPQRVAVARPAGLSTGEGTRHARGSDQGREDL